MDSLVYINNTTVCFKCYSILETARTKSWQVQWNGKLCCWVVQIWISEYHFLHGSNPSFCEHNRSQYKVCYITTLYSLVMYSIHGLAFEHRYKVPYTKRHALGSMESLTVLPKLQIWKHPNKCDNAICNFFKYIYIYICVMHRLWELVITCLNQDKGWLLVMGPG